EVRGEPVQLLAGHPAVLPHVFAGGLVPDLSVDLLGEVPIGRAVEVDRRLVCARCHEPERTPRRSRGPPRGWDTSVRQDPTKDEPMNKSELVEEISTRTRLPAAAVGRGVET